MRLSVEPRSSRLSLPARHLSYGKTRPPILEFLTRMIELLRRMHFQRIRRASYRRGNIEIIDVDDRAEDLVRVRPELRTRRGRALNATNSRRLRVAAPRKRAPRRPRRAAECVRRFTISSCL
jgi:hypothetical protein